MKIVINVVHGGFSLSDEALELLEAENDWDYHNDRTNPYLIAVVEKLGERADGMCATLRVIDIPDDVDYTIEEYDGLEHIAEKHRTWS